MTKLKNHTIKILMKNLTDRNLLKNYLQELGYTVNDSFAEEWSKFSMIITDEFYAKQFNKNLLLLKKQPGVMFLPFVIMLSKLATNASAWIRTGYDEVLRLPLPKSSLKNKIKNLLRLREQTQARYDLIFDNLSIGIYWMNSKNRVLLANATFVKILGYKCFEQIRSQNLVELGVTFQEHRKYFLQKLVTLGKVYSYESCWKLKNGRRVSIRETATLIDHDSSDFYYIGTIENISNFTHSQNDTNSAGRK